MSEKEVALPEPVSADRPAPLPPPRGFARLRSALERSYWECMEFLESAANRRARAIVMSGAEKHSGLPLRVLYFGSGNHLAWVQGLLYREHRVLEEHSGLKVWNARSRIAQHRSAVDLVVADLPWPWQRLLTGQVMVEVPAWINQRMPLPGKWQDVFGQLRRSARGEDMRSIRKHRLEYRLVRDEEAVRRFYDELYVPHLTRRFGAAAYIEPAWKIAWCVETGTLMEIRRGGQLVAAQVLWGNRGSMHFLWSGALGEEFGSHSRGVFPALYYYGILHSFEQGCDEVDYCGSRPVLSDGIVQLKRRWGGRVFDGWSRDTLFIRPLHLRDANRELLARNPLIARRDGGLVGKLFFGTEPVGPADVERTEQLYATPGITEIRLYSLLPPLPETLEAARARPAIEIVDLSAEPDPAAAYCRR
ncbi:MAG: GNAT family N-acetyltransferase [Steroidobacteraceae bacterium]